MQINRINTFTNNNNRNNKNKGRTSNPSFGLYLPPNFKNMAVNEIKAISNTHNVLKEFAKDCNILISSGIRMIETGWNGSMNEWHKTGRPVKCFKITFSELGSENKSKLTKLKEKFTGEVTEFPHLSKHTVQGTYDEAKPIEELEEILKDAVTNGKVDFRTAFKVEEKEAIAEATKQMALNNEHATMFHSNGQT